MSIIEKVFKYEETELSVIKHQDDIWFRGKTLAEILGYSSPLKAIGKHLDILGTSLRTNSEIPFTLRNLVYIA